MKIFKFVLVTFIFTTIMTLISTMVQAQPPGGCDPDQPCPIDDNVLLLIVGAIVLAAYKYYTAAKKKLVV
jgi:hypothetical protein